MGLCRSGDVPDICRLLSYGTSVLDGDSIQVWASGPDFPSPHHSDSMTAMSLLQQGFAVSSCPGPVRVFIAV